MQLSQGVLREQTASYFPAQISSASLKVRRQHHLNLLGLLRHCVDHGETSTAASLCLMLLAAAQASSQNEGRVSKEFLTQNGLPLVLEAIFRLVKQSSLGDQEVLHLLQQLLKAQPNPEGVEKASLDVAFTALEQGDLTLAHRTLSMKPSGGPKVENATLSATRATYCACIRHQQWMEIMHGLRKQQFEQHAAVPFEQGPPGDITFEDGGNGVRRLPGRSAEAAALQSMWRYDRLLTLSAKGNRALKAAWRECEIELKNALRLSPGTTLLSMLLCHTYIVGGQLREAVHTARKAAAAAPTDVDAHMLNGLLQQLREQKLLEGWEDEEGDEQEEEEEEAGQQGMHSTQDFVNDNQPQSQQQRQQQEPVVYHEVVQQMLEALQLDPASDAALEGVLAQRQKSPECQLAAAEACLLYLDMAGTRSCLPLESTAWGALSSSLSNLAHALLALGGPHTANVLGIHVAQHTARHAGTPMCPTHRRGADDVQQPSESLTGSQSSSYSGETGGSGSDCGSHEEDDSSDKEEGGAGAQSKAASRGRRGRVGAGSSDSSGGDGGSDSEGRVAGAGGRAKGRRAQGRADRSSSKDGDGSDSGRGSEGAEGGAKGQKGRVRRNVDSRVMSNAEDSSGEEGGGGGRCEKRKRANEGKRDKGSRKRKRVTDSGERQRSEGDEAGSRGLHGGGVGAREGGCSTVQDLQQEWQRMVDAGRLVHEAPTPPLAWTLWQRLRASLADRAYWWEAGQEQLFGAAIAEGVACFVKRLLALQGGNIGRKEGGGASVELGLAGGVGSASEGQVPGEGEEMVREGQGKPIEGEGDEGSAADEQGGVRQWTQRGERQPREQLLRERQKAVQEGLAAQWCARMAVAAHMLGPQSPFVREVVHRLCQIEEQGGGPVLHKAQPQHGGCSGSSARRMGVKGRRPQAQYTFVPVARQQHRREGACGEARIAGGLLQQVQASRSLARHAMCFEFAILRAPPAQTTPAPANMNSPTQLQQQQQQQQRRQRQQQLFQQYLSDRQEQQQHEVQQRHLVELQQLRERHSAQLESLEQRFRERQQQQDQRLLRQQEGQKHQQLQQHEQRGQEQGAQVEPEQLGQGGLSSEGEGVQRPKDVRQLEQRRREAEVLSKQQKQRREEAELQRQQQREREAMEELHDEEQRQLQDHSRQQASVVQGAPSPWSLLAPPALAKVFPMARRRPS